MKSTSLLQTLPRLMVELIVIVVGILLALWVDAYWGERKDRQEERVALTTIHEEFVENKQSFDHAFDNHTRIYEALALISNSTPADCDEELDATLETAVFHWQTFNPSVGATQSLITSGQIGLIRDDTLRVQLASWSGHYSDLVEDEMRTVAASDRITEYIAHDFPEFDCPALLGDKTFMFLLGLREFAEFTVIDENDRIPEVIQLILDAADPAKL
jgi:hypothetical protein